MRMRSGVLLIVVALGAATAWAATPVTITGLPQVNASTLIADGTAPYTVTMTGTDVDGYANIRALAVLFDYTEANPEQAMGRGYMKWGRADEDVTQWGGAWVVADATGGGRWGYNGSAWGGTTYITPLSCDTTVAGKATGGAGTRTATWTFTVKPTWAHTPVMNDADGWAADGTLGQSGSFNIGWIDGQTSFDVVADPCGAACATPAAPLLSNVAATTIDISLNPADSAADQYAIAISPSVGGRMYVQSDGSLGTGPRWSSRASWGTRRVSGLSWNTTYSFSVRATRNVPGYCPSAWGPAAQATTANPVPLIDIRGGTAFSPWVRGQCPYRNISTANWPLLWDLTTGALGRGLAGGLDADTYDWRDLGSGSLWGRPTSSGAFTTLEFLQAARDHGVAPMLTANAFGGGYIDAARNNSFVCQNVNPGGLAADWVRYTNIILQQYRQGQEGSLTGEDARVLNSITNWAGRPTLPAEGEAAPPRVDYWEIGNEPELGGIDGMLLDHYLSPEDYRDRYKLIAEAMKAVDPALKFGPCLISPGDAASQWLPVLAADPQAQIDFVSYHPYDGAVKYVWGHPEEMSTALRACRPNLINRTEDVREVLTAAGRSGVGLVASEWNPVNWDAPGIMQSSMAAGLAVVDSCFTFAEDGVLAATFWEQPQSKRAVAAVYAGLVQDMGDVLLASSPRMGLLEANTNYRFYVTTSQANPSRIAVWGVNYDEHIPVTVELGLANCVLDSATLKRYGKPGDDAAGGDTSLAHYSGTSWTQQDATAGLDPSHFSFTMEDAEVTVLVLNILRVPRADFDRDRDVDQDDFALLQRCMSGSTVPQTNPACQAAHLDHDEDVDTADFAVFQGCFTSPGVPAAAECAD